MSIPQVVDDIVTKSLAFKVKVQPTYKRCSFIQVSEDSQVIESLLDKITPVKVRRNVEKGKVVCAMLNEDDGVECQQLSATGDYDPEHMVYLTPKKMLGSTVLFEDDQDVAFEQLSSTKKAKHVHND
ncbi:unnamed protein product [Lupinus luteus]|uniref:Uncharacterized protein n=1 Tax=Lupinus luteus TaxID=3873 RepID=A0AAV1W344_LUPLU